MSYCAGPSGCGVKLPEASAHPNVRKNEDGVGDAAGGMTNSAAGVCKCSVPDRMRYESVNTGACPSQLHCDAVNVIIDASATYVPTKRSSLAVVGEVKARKSISNRPSPVVASPSPVCPSAATYIHVPANVVDPGMGDPPAPGAPPVALAPPLADAPPVDVAGPGDIAPPHPIANKYATTTVSFHMPCSVRARQSFRNSDRLFSSGAA